MTIRQNGAASRAWNRDVMIWLNSKPARALRDLWVILEVALLRSEAFSGTALNIVRTLSREFRKRTAVECWTAGNRRFLLCCGWQRKAETPEHNGHNLKVHICKIAPLGYDCNWVVNCRPVSRLTAGTWNDSCEADGSHDRARG